jgi:Family of unknown function (DUF6390)
MTLSPARRSDAGHVVFARYAFPPNELGYCGPDGAGELLSHAATGSDAATMTRRARAFDGAWPYLEVIAAAAGIEDPLDPRVVDAYWVGNDLLGAVEPARLLDALGERFAGQVGGFWTRVTPDLTPLAHHSFQVLAVYPWVGLLRTGSPVPLSVLDSCRIRWGTVSAVDGEHATVTSCPLTFATGVLALGAEREERVRWALAGEALAGGLAVGDRVSLHWDWVCDRLTSAQLDALAAASARQLDLANRYL